MLPAHRFLACSGLKAREDAYHLARVAESEAAGRGFQLRLQEWLERHLAACEGRRLMGALRGELAKLLGPEGLRKLSAARGGREARIPKRVPPGHWLERAVGRELAGRMAWRYGGCRIYIPLRPPPAGRDRAILERRRRGLGIAAIAAEVGLSERRVQQILARGRSE